MANKKLSIINNNGIPSPRITPQELQIRQLLQAEAIPFEFQKTFCLNSRRFIVDFFINNCIILECSFSSMKKYQIAFRQKAIQLEARCSIINNFYDYPIWILLETLQSVSPQFQRNLIRLMPSIDTLLTSFFDFSELVDEFKEIVNDLNSFNFKNSPSNGIKNEILLKDDSNESKSLSSTNFEFVRSIEGEL